MQSISAFVYISCLLISSETMLMSAELKWCEWLQKKLWTKGQRDKLSFGQKDKWAEGISLDLHFVSSKKYIQWHFQT